MSSQQYPSSPKDLLAQAGWYTADQWAAAFDEEAKTFREKIRSSNIPQAPWGNCILVHATDLLQHLQDSRGTNGKKK